MPFVLLLLAFLLYVQETWSPPMFDVSPRDAGLLSLGLMGLFVLLAGVLSLAIGHALRIAPYDRYAILNRFGRWRRRHFFAMVGAYLVALYVLGWGWAVADSVGPAGAPVAKVVVLSPLLIGLVLSWNFFYDVERAAHAMLWITPDARFPDRGPYLLLNVRHSFLLVVPPLLLMTAQDTLEHFVPELKRSEDFPYLTLAAVGTLMAAGIVGIPWLLRVFLGLTPLPTGELRDHLFATARRLNFGFADVLVWNTRGAVANALVTGMLPRIRYVVLTDRLIQELSVPEIEAVFGHEVGHIKHHHMTLYVVFLVLSLVALGAGWTLGLETIADRLAPSESWIAEILEHQEWFLVVVAVYVFLVFGVLSRHCERQADMFGCNVSSRDVFIRALERVADLNGMSREKPGWLTAWQHWTVGQRVEFLRRLDTDPTLEARTQRRIGILKWSITLTLAAFIVVLLSVNPWGWLKHL